MSFAYNVGSLALQNGDCDFEADDIEIILTRSTYTPNRDDTSAVYAAAEIPDISGYTGGYDGAGRALLTGKSIESNTDDDQTEYHADDPEPWTLGVGATIGGMIIGKKGAADDTTAIPLFFLGLAGFPGGVATTGIEFGPTFLDGIVAMTKQNP